MIAFPVTYIAKSVPNLFFTIGMLKIEKKTLVTDKIADENYIFCFYVFRVFTKI